MSAWVYIMASKRNGTLYVGVSSDLAQRVWEHKADIRPGFTSQYGCKILVWHERHFGMPDAIQREKSLKRYIRKWKLNLIETLNPNWQDLYETLWDIDNPSKQILKAEAEIASGSLVFAVGKTKDDEI